MHPIADFLKAHGIRLNTDLGQHFLVDDSVLQAIVESAGIEETDHIVEIGPGIGVLTAELLRRARLVTAIEFDKRLIPLFEEFITKNQKLQTKNLEIIQGNALHTSFPSEPYKIVANIPYHITSPLLRHAFLESKKTPTSMTLLIQREVAEKICQPVRGPAGDTEDAGMLTILVALFGSPSYMGTVPPEAFLPPPAVDSAILHINCFEKPLASPEILEEIFRLTKIGFGQKRKMLRNTLGNLPDGIDLLEKTGIDPTRRPQTLSIEEWISLATHSLP